MQMGFNNDVPYRGLVLHIQTEDHGLPAAKVTSHVFFSGAIVDSLTRSYADEIGRIEDPLEQEEFIRRFMKGMHRLLFRRIQAGDFDARLPLAERPVPAAMPTPAPVAVPAAVEVPPDSFDSDAFRVVGEMHELGVEYEANSRGERMDTMQLQAPGDTTAWKGLPESTWTNATQIGETLVRALGRAE